MKLVIIEPLGIPKQSLLQLAADQLDESIEIIYYDTKVTDTASLIERGKDADIIAVSNLPLNSDFINGCPNLKMLSVAFTGIDHIDMNACRKRGIVVSNCAGYSTSAVADLVFGLIVSLHRNIIPCNEAIRSGGTRDGLIGYELEGKKFGVIGTGEIGTKVAKIANAFGCKVYAYSKTLKFIPDVTFTDLDPLLATCDIVSIHVPLDDTTRGLMNKEKLSLMKPTSLLINTARGPIVDSDALAEALNCGALAGAGIDVFENEPPIASNHPLLYAKNLIATPHIAFATKEALRKRAIIMLNNIKAYQIGFAQNVV